MACYNPAAFPEPALTTSTANPQAPAAAPSAAGAARRALLSRVLAVVWLSILLGFAIETLLLAAAAGFGTLGSGGFATVRPFLADLVQKVSWSAVVCVGLSFGTAATRARPAVMGLLGMLAAPSAFTLARALHKGVTAALGLAGGALVGPSPLLIALVKALQYALFGVALGWLSRRRDAGLRAYVLVGLAAGLVFGGLVLGLMAAAAPLPAPALVARAIDELLFPIGCALVIWVSGVLAERV